MNENIENNEKEKVEPTTSEAFKKHWAKHKKKYIIGGIAALAFGLGFHFGNRGNSRHHYSRLLRDGVKDAVEDGMRDLVEDSMQEVVEDGMNVVIHDAVSDVVRSVVKREVRDVVGESVKQAIKESGVTIIKEVVTTETKMTKDTDSESIQKVVDLVNALNGTAIRKDENGNLYTAKHTK